MRLFTAIDIAPAVAANLQDLLNRLRPLAKLSWSRIQNLHVTTKFLGEWPEQRLHEVTDALRTLTPTGTISIVVRGLGWFPDTRNPRVFWAGVEAPETLSHLAAATQRSLERIGVQFEDREFHPHLTLARRRKPVPLAELQRAIQNLPSTEFGSFQASTFFLYLSSGGKYTKLQEFPLC